MISISRTQLIKTKGHLDMPFFDITKLQQDKLNNIKEVIYDVVASKGGENEKSDQ